MEADQYAWWKHLGLLLLFLGFPLLLADIGFQYVLQIKQENWEHEQFRILDAALARREPLADTEAVIKSTLKKLAAEADQAETPLQVLRTRLGLLSRKCPGLVDWVIFDEKDSVAEMTGQSSRRVPEMLLESFREYFQASALKQSIDSEKVLHRNKRFIWNYLGTIKKTLRFFDGSGWIVTSSRPRKTWFFYSLGRRFSLFVNVHREGYPPFLALKRNIGKTTPDGIDMHLIDMGDTQIMASNSAENSSVFKQIALRSEREAGSHFFENNRFFSCLSVSSEYILIASKYYTHESFPKFFIRYFRLFSGGLFVVLFGISFVFLHSKTFFFSIRLKMVGLFLFLSILNLSLLVFVARVFLQEREKSLIHDSVETNRLQLLSVDGKMKIILRILQKSLKELFFGINISDPALLERLRERIKVFRSAYGFLSINLLDTAGKEISLYGEPSNTPILGTVFMGALSELSGEAPSQEYQRKAAEVEMMAELLSGDTLKEIIDDLIGQFGKIIPQNWGLTKTYSYSNAVKDREGKLTHGFTMAWHHEQISRLYIERFMYPRPLADGTRLMVVQNQANWRFSGGTREPTNKPLTAEREYWRFPKRPITPEFRDFVLDTMKMKQYTFRLIRYRGVLTLVSGLPGKNLDGFFLFSLKPLTGIETELGEVRKRLWLLALLSIIFAALLGWLVARSFLQPIGELSLGLEAAQKRNFQYRIPLQNNDELGELAHHFNRMLEGLKELDWGRQIQHQLFPREVLEVGDYTVYGLSRTASELGGDYFDYFVAGDKIIVLIGDVTGHGLPAALVMGMSKSLVSTLARLNLPCTQIIELLNEFLFVNFRGRKVNLNLTFSLLEIIWKTHQTTLFHCGHPPLFLGKGNIIEETKPPSGLPVGAALKFRLNPARIDLKPGFRGYYYTDGLVESLIIPEKVDAFRAFRDFLQERYQEDIVRACQNVFDEHPALKNNQIPPDDCTIVMVERKEESASS
jgi:serine phosphatase RsbU (regulator of sigma subunit)